MVAFLLASGGLAMTFCPTRWQLALTNQGPLASTRSAEARSRKPAERLLHAAELCGQVATRHAHAF